MKSAGKVKESTRPDGGLPDLRRRRPRILAIFTLATRSSFAAARPALAQPPKPFIPDITERSGLLMRSAATPEMLPPDPNRDFFYQTRYADSGRVKHPNWVCTQGLYGTRLEDARHEERLSLLLRHPWPEHD